MKRPLILSILLLFICRLTYGATITKTDVDNSLKQLDKEIALRWKYISFRESRIDSIRQCLSHDIPGPRLLDLIMQLGDLFCSFNNDSALIYYTHGYDKSIEFGDSVNAFRFRAKRATILPLSGFVSDAIQEFEDIDMTQLPEEDITLYHTAGRQMYSYISSFFTNYPETHDYWNRKAIAHRDSLLARLDHSTLTYDLNNGEYLIDKGDYKKAKVVLLNLLDHITPNSNLYARACHMLAIIAREKGNRDEEAYYLAMSAMADIKCAVREVMSLQELGIMMSENNNIDRAYDYLSAALTNAVECNATMRIIQSSSALPLIQKAHADQVEAWRYRIYMVIGCIIIILIVLIIALLALRKQMRKQNQFKVKILSANHVKEIYINQFFRLCSIYIDKLNQFCKIANRKISSGQVDDLYKITKSGKLVEEQSEEFYKLFDDAFLHIYPTFVEDVNELLRDKIVLKDGEMLNNDLRILAFMRLGLEDTNQVAIILNYSVNTIYAYRNKLRNRAFDRDNFEQNIMSIGAINES